MAEQATLDLARRYRPKTLTGYIGNERMVETIKRSFEDRDRSAFPRKIMVTGTTGCGKTTIARILTRSYLCENPQNGWPCEECSMCKETAHYVETGDYSALDGDLVEVNVGSIRGVDAIESVIDTFDYQPMMGDMKVYIFDECQSLSNVAQDAMLKKMEDLPDYIVLIFCTTNREAINDTIINRCNLDLTVRKPPLNDLLKLMQGICQREKYKFDKAGLREIAIASDNVIRQSLQNLERVLTTHASEGATQSVVEKELEVMPEKDTMEFYKCLTTDNVNGYVQLIYKIVQKGQVRQFLSSAETMLERGLLVINGVTSVEGLTPVEIQDYASLFKDFTQQEIVHIASGLRRVRKGSEATVLNDLVILMYTFHDGNSTNNDDVVPTVKSDKKVNEDKVLSLVREEEDKKTEEVSNANVEKSTGAISAEEVMGIWN